MTTEIRFHFDPTCPWAWQASRWMREVERVRDVTVTWRLFALSLVNDERPDPLRNPHVKGTPPLRAMALVERELGNGRMGELYRAYGERVHDRGLGTTKRTLLEALLDVGLDEGLIESAMQQEWTAREVAAQHEAAVAAVDAFGVPTLILPSGKGIFGPALAEAPVGERAGEMWDHVSWLVEVDGFYELKRTRDRRPGREAAA